MIHLFICDINGEWEFWKSLPRQIGLRHIEYLNKCGVNIEYTGW